jgi:hypothetical protein
MESFIFLFDFIKILYFVRLIKSKRINLRNLNQDNNSELCSLKVNNCFYCNSPYSSCIYEKGVCSYYDNEKNDSNLWYSKLNLCNDEESKEKAKNYCGQIIYSDSQNKFIISNSNLYGNSIENLFCLWEISNEKKYGDIKIVFSDVKDNFYLSFVIINSDKNSYSKINGNYSKKISKKKYTKIQIIYFHHKKPNSNPFILEIQTNVGLKLSLIIFYFIIGIIIFFISILMCTLIIFIRKGSNTLIKKEKKYEIEKLKSVKYKKELNIFNNNCPICLEEIEIDLEIILLNCNHAFHIQCLMKYIKYNIIKNRKCPVCNQPFFNNNRINTSSSISTLPSNNNE